MDPDALRGLGFSAVFIPWLYMTPYKPGQTRNPHEVSVID